MVRAGQYKLSFWGKDIGEEQFTIYRTPGGYRIEATAVPKAGDQAPSESIYLLDPKEKTTQVAG